jgi:hypothetical protein
MKRQHTEWENIFASYSLDKGLTSSKYKELKTVKHQKNNPINKCANEWNRQFSEEL